MTALRLSLGLLALLLALAGPGLASSLPLAAPPPPPPLPLALLRPAEVPAETPVADVVLASASLAGSPAPPGRAPADPGLLRLAYPLTMAAQEVDPYGWRYSDSRQVWRMHAGQDLIVPEGTPVLAMLPGQVVLVEPLDGYGLTVVLDHGQGWQTLYAHLLSTDLQLGDRLAQGAVLGQVGQSGRASTAHLHVELRRRLGDRMVALDPTPLLEQAQGPRKASL